MPAKRFPMRDLTLYFLLPLLLAVVIGLFCAPRQSNAAAEAGNKGERAGKVALTKPAPDPKAAAPSDQVAI